MPRTAASSLPAPGPVAAADTGAAGTGLAGVRAAVAGLAARVEARISAAAAPLADAADTASQLSRAFQTVSDGLGTLDLKRIRKNSTLIAEAAERLRGKLVDEMLALAEVERGLGAAGRAMDDIGRAIRTIEIVAQTGRIYAAEISSGTDALDGFSEEMDTLTRSARDVLEGFRKQHGNFASRLAASREGFTAFEETFMSRLTGLADRIDGAMDPIEARAALLGQDSQRARRLSEETSKRLIDLVAAMQVGDNVRQRLEHVAAALEHEDEPAVIELQRRQMRAASDHLGRETSVIEQSLQALEQSAADAPALLNALLKSNGGNGPALQLEEELGRATALLVKCAAERRHLESSLAVAVRQVDGITSNIPVIRKIEQHMQIVSLNATVRCARIGRGAEAMAMVSRQLDELTRETRGAAQDFITSMQEVAGRIHLEGEDAAASDAEHLQKVGAEAGLALGNFTHLSREHEKAIEGLSRSAPALGRLFADTRERLREIADIAAEMAAVHKAFGAGAPGRAPVAAAGILASLRPNYTMAEERRVHDDYAGAPSEPPPAAIDEDDFMMF